MPMLWTTETTIFIRMIARNSVQRKQPYLWFKQIMIETCYENTTQTTAFWVLAETFIHTIYIIQYQQPVHCLKMETLMSRCTTETTETTIFWSTTRMSWQWMLKQPIQPFFHDNINRFMYFLQQTLAMLFVQNKIT